MTLQQAIEVLELHNKWRKGAEIPQGNPHIIGMAIDIIVGHFKEEPITKQALLDRGFSFRICHYNGEVSDNYRLANKNISIEIYGRNFRVIELQTEFYLLPIPNCRTLKQLDALIDLLKE